jgi:acetoacetate decarboxylase
MTEHEILDRASMPPGNPSYPFGPYRFVDRQYFMVIYETDAAAIRA